MNFYIDLIANIFAVCKNRLGMIDHPLKVISESGDAVCTPGRCMYLDHQNLIIYFCAINTRKLFCKKYKSSTKWKGVKAWLIVSSTISRLL